MKAVVYIIVLIVCIISAFKTCVSCIESDRQWEAYQREMDSILADTTRKDTFRFPPPAPPDTFTHTEYTDTMDSAYYRKAGAYRGGSSSSYGSRHTSKHVDRYDQGYDDAYEGLERDDAYPEGRSESYDDGYYEGEIQRYDDYGY